MLLVEFEGELMEAVRTDEDYYVYIVECIDGTLYTGISNRLRERIAQHNRGEGAKYTRGRIPVELLYSERHDSKSLALKREYRIKKLSREQKLQLIKGG